MRAIQYFVLCVVVLGLAGIAVAEDPSASAAQPGMRIDIDPATGETLDQPAAPAGGARSAGGTTMSTSSAGLQEVAGPTAAGGVTVQLQGRFHNAMTVQVDADGKTVSNCATDPTAAQVPR